jgi:DNA-binding transcriptional regulator LsrR (DeoR family)
MAKAAKKETELANLGPKVVVHHEGGRRENAMALLEWMRKNAPVTGQQIIDAHGYARNTFHSYISLLMHEGHVEISNHKSTPVGKTSWALGIYTVKTKQ